MDLRQKQIARERASHDSNAIELLSMKQQANDKYPYIF